MYIKTIDLEITLNKFDRDLNNIKGQFFCFSIWRVEKKRIPARKGRWQKKMYMLSFQIG